MWLTAILKLLPLLIQVAEIAHPQPKSGADKLSTVLSTVTSIAGAVPAIADQVKGTLPLITDAVNGIVDVANAAGGFGIKHVAEDNKVQTAVNAAAAAVKAWEAPGGASG